MLDRRRRQQCVDDRRGVAGVAADGAGEGAPAADYRIGDAEDAVGKPCFQCFKGGSVAVAGGVGGGEVWMPFSNSPMLRMLMNSRSSSCAGAQLRTLGAPFGEVSDAMTLVLISQPVKAPRSGRNRARGSGRGRRVRAL